MSPWTSRGVIALLYGNESIDTYNGAYWAVLLTSNAPVYARREPKQWSVWLPFVETRIRLCGQPEAGDAPLCCISTVWHKGSTIAESNPQQRDLSMLTLKTSTKLLLHMFSSLRLLLFGITACSTVHVNAQIVGAPRQFKHSTELFDPDPKLIKLHAPLFTASRLYSFESTQVYFKKYKRFFLYAYPMDGSPAIGKELEFPRENDCYEQDFFLLGDQPAVLYSWLENDSNKLKYYYQRYDGTDLSPLGPPVALGSLSFVSSGGFTRRDLLDNISPDGNYQAFVFPHMIEEGTKNWIATCWVLDRKDGSKVWSATFKFPVDMPEIRWIQIDNEGRILVNVKAKSNNPNGQTRKDHPYELSSDRSEKLTHQWFRLSHDGMQHWDGWLPDGRVLVNGDLIATNDENVIGGFLNALEKMAPRQWYIATMNESFQPELLATGDLVLDKPNPLDGVAFGVAEDGTFALGSSYEDASTLMVISTAGEVQWTTTWPSFTQGLNLFWNGDRLYQPFLGFESDVAAIFDGKKVKLTGYLRRPILRSWDKAGKLSVDLPLNDDQGAERDVIYYGETDFRSIGRHGVFLDHDYTSKRERGVVLVPLQ